MASKHCNITRNGEPDMRFVLFLCQVARLLSCSPDCCSVHFRVSLGAMLLISGLALSRIFSFYKAASSIYIILTAPPSPSHPHPTPSHPTPSHLFHIQSIPPLTII